MPYAPDAILFDGTTDFQLRGGDLTGIANGKQGIVSCWLKTLNSAAAIVIRGADFDFSFSVESNGFVRIFGTTSVGATILTATASTAVHNGLWHHVMASWDLAIGAVHLYLDDQEDLAPSVIAIDDTIGYTDTQWSIGAAAPGGVKFDGPMSDLYLNTAEFLDLSIEANRRKFIDADGIAVYLGDVGELPTGTASIVYMRGIQTNQALNSGTGGDFVSQATQVPGETTGPTEPNPGNASVPYLPEAILFDGTTDFMLRGGDLIGLVDGKQGILNFWFRIDGGDGTIRFVIMNGPTSGGRFIMRLETTNVINIAGVNAAGTLIMQMFDSGLTVPLTAGPAYHHFLSSWDLGATTGLTYIDDVQLVPATTTFTDDVIDYSMAVPDWTVGAEEDGTNKYDGALSDIYFNASAFLDLSVEANRRKFVDSSGDPVFLGDDGTLPTGDFPEIYLPGTQLDQGFNGGSGGDFVSQGVQVPGETLGPGQPGALPGGPGDDMRHLARRSGRFHRFFRG